MKIDRRRKYYMVLDTETANDLDYPLVYDIGYAIIDKYGNIYKTESFVIADVFYGEEELMSTAYYAEKIPMYLEDIENEQRTVISLFAAKLAIKEDLERYNIVAVLAYNASFDLRAVNTTQRYETKSKYRWFFPYGTEIWCIWNMACNTICNTERYINFAIENGLESEAGNIQTGAEMVWKYISGDTDFEEIHTGLDDVMIEKEIFAYCVKRKGITKIEKEINRSCWRIPQKLRKEMGRQTIVYLSSYINLGVFTPKIKL